MRDPGLPAKNILHNPPKSVADGQTHREDGYGDEGAKNLKKGGKQKRPMLLESRMMFA